MNRSTPGLPVHLQLLESTQTHVHWVGDAVQPSHPLLSPSPPSFNLFQHQGLFKWVSVCIRWPKYWSFSFSISPCKEHSGLISFRIGWLDLLAIQGTLRSLHHHSSKSINSSKAPGGATGKESACHCRRCKRRRFDPWVEKIAWSRKWQTSPVFLPGESHGQRGLEGYSPWGHKESDITEHTLNTWGRRSGIF